MKTNNNKSQSLFLSELNKSSFWRLAVDGNKQKTSNTSTFKINNGQELPEYAYGHLAWTLREPHSLNYFRKTALDVFSKKLDSELTLEFLKEVNSSIFPGIDHLNFSTDHFVKGVERTFGLFDSKYEESILKRQNEILLWPKNIEVY